MTPWNNQDSFLSAFDLTSKISSSITPIISIVGAGGKTSLIFQLANEAKACGGSVLVTTTTKMWVPKKHQYDFIDLSGDAFKSHKTPLPTGIYVTGINASQDGKMRGTSEIKLRESINKFDLVLIEADGSATKPLKGWKKSEPVIFPETSCTIGVVDISTIGQPITTEHIHRLNIFTELTKSSEGETVAIRHLQRLITSSNGLLGKSQGESFVYLNKVESEQHFNNARILKEQLPDIKLVIGSVHKGEIYA